ADPGSPVALAGAGHCYEILGKPGRARMLWRQSLGMLQRTGAGLTPLAWQLQHALDAYDRHPVVFISYAHLNQRKVEGIQRHLTGLGCRTRIDFQAFVPGRSVQEEILRVMDECSTYLIAWSRHYRGRAFTKFE